MTEAVGGCECGAIRYRLAATPEAVNCCHCRDCQTITGSAFALNALVDADAIVVTRGEPVCRSLMREGSGETRASRCSACETLLWADHPMMGESARFVRVGTLDRGEAFAPTAHFFVRSKHPWIALPPSVPAYDTLPPQ